MKTLLLIEDNFDIRDMLRDYLTEHGYTVRVASNGRQGLQEARQAAPDLVLLDIMMPEMDGLDFLRAFRADFQVPVIVLTARDSELDKVLGLELGADDYVTKPFSLAELLARVRAQLRRGQTDVGTARLLQVGELELNPTARTVQVRGQMADLTRTEFDLLHTLMRVPGRVFTRAELLEAVQDEMTFGSERTIDVHIRNLRSKLEEHPAQPQLVQTVFGVGYRLGAG